MLLVYSVYQCCSQPANASSWCSAVKAAEDVDAYIEAVEATVSMSGWPSVPQPVLQVSSLLLLLERACDVLITAHVRSRQAR